MAFPKISTKIILCIGINLKPRGKQLSKLLVFRPKIQIRRQQNQLRCANLCQLKGAEQQITYSQCYFLRIRQLILTRYGLICESNHKRTVKKLRAEGLNTGKKS